MILIQKIYLRSTSNSKKKLLDYYRGNLTKLITRKLLESVDLWVIVHYPTAISDGVNPASRMLKEISRILRYENSLKNSFARPRLKT